MKLLVVLFSTFLIAYAIDPEILETVLTRVKKIGGECKTEIGASDDDIEPIKTHNLPTTPEGKRFLACLFEKMGTLDSEGKINPEELEANIKIFKEKDETVYNQLKQVIDICVGLVNDEGDKCETAVELMSCTEREKKVVGFKNVDMDF